MINKRQYVFLSFYLTRSLFFGGAISLLLGVSKNNLLMTSLLGMILGLFILYLFYKKDGINRYLRIVMAFIALFIVILSNTTLTSNYLLYETSELLIMFLFLIPLMYSTFKEDKIIGRVSEVLFPVSLFFVTFSFVALWYLVNISNLFPLFNSSIFNFIKGIIIFAVASSLPNILLIKYKDSLSFMEISLGYLMGTIIILINMFFIISIYGSSFASILRFPEYLILKKIDVFNYISNVENIFVLEWLCNLLVAGMFFMRELFNTMRLKKFLILDAILFGIMYLVLNNNFWILVFIKKYIYFLCGIVIMFGLVLKKDKSQG